MTQPQWSLSATARDPVRVGVLVVGWVCVALALVRLVGVRDIDRLPALITISVLAVVLQLTPMLLHRRRDEQIRVVSTALLFALLFVWGIQIAVVPVIVFTLAWGAYERAPWLDRLYSVAHFTLGLVAARLVLLGSFGPIDLAHSRTAFDADDVLWLPPAALAYVLADTALAVAARPDRRRFLAQLARKARGRAPMLISIIALSPVVVILAAVAWYLLPALMVPVLLLYYTAATAQAREAAALRDELTGLPNRAALRRRLDRSIAHWREHDTPFALFVVDLDDVARVNDALGHEAGEQVIVRFTRVLQDELRPDDFLARLDGDGWAILITDVDAARAGELAERLRAAVATPVTVDGIALSTRASVGVAVCPRHGQTATELLRQADVALRLAKRSGTRAEVYGFDSDPNSVDRLRLLGELRAAIGTDALQLYHQPKIDTRTGTPTGVEALARWQHPQRGFVPPELFVSIAEGTEVIQLLTARVVDLAVAQAGEWYRAGIAVPIAVNVSPSDLADIGLVSRVTDALRRHELPPRLLTLEITERVMLDDIDSVRRHLDAFRRMGVRVSLDDFGTEYSTLLRLQLLPVDEIKIDRAFIELLGTQDDAGIVAAVITLAHTLGLTVVAEGVETLGQLEILRGYGCDSIQGHLVAGPMAAEQATRWLREHLPPPDTARPRLRSV